MEKDYKCKGTQMNSMRRVIYEFAIKGLFKKVKYLHKTVIMI